MPRKWSQQFNIKKGDELEVEEDKRDRCGCEWFNS
ncbi:AbrB/MazE/SpoVT family DNA-binding domain-containing protein [Candidatus Woesearchaeota archaeon]|nr:AbrB/MazE/SpoVT family DNA-binding domain-containing protein [Candidatus Woesearchaeota archaeon]